MSIYMARIHMYLYECMKLDAPLMKPKNHFFGVKVLNVRAFACWLKYFGKVVKYEDVKRMIYDFLGKDF